MSRSSSTSAALRPCLKHSTDLDPPPSANSSSNPFPFALCPSVMGHRVHFPPAPVLCQTHLTHSSSIYDRAPIVVLPNTCALPERNGRTYPPSNNEYTSSSSSSSKRRSTQHPKVAQVATATGAAALHHPHAFRDTSMASSDSPTRQHQHQHQHQLPQLVPDLSSSESDESDINSLPPDLTHFSSTGHPPISIIDGSGDVLSFLPHANERESQGGSAVGPVVPRARCGRASLRLSWTVALEDSECSPLFLFSFLLRFSFFVFF
jgi:hypothetical protein